MHTHEKQQNVMDEFDEVEDLVSEDARKRFSDKVIEHFRHPRNHGKLETYDCYTYMTGMCGDTVGFFVKLSSGRVSEIGFETDGCGPTIACASALSELAKEKTLKQLLEMKGKDLLDHLDGLPIENTHCADLAVNTLKGALEKYRS